MVKVIGRIYKYDQKNMHYTAPNTTFVIPPRFDTSIQTQRNIVYYASASANDELSSGLDQSTNHHGNTDGKKNDYSQSYETPRKNNCCSSSHGDTITTTIFHTDSTWKITSIISN